MRNSMILDVLFVLLSESGSNEFRAQRLTQFIRGWVNYFKLADMKKLLFETDEWLRRKSGLFTGNSGRRLKPDTE